MKNWLACLGVVLLMVAVGAVAAVAAAPKLAGTWYINGKFIEPGQTAALNLPTMTVNLAAADNDPTLFYGAFTGPEGDPNFMTIMMDAGANMHFTVSNHVNPQGEPVEGWYTRTTGRGTASASKITGWWSDDRGKTGNFIFTRQP
jgi:hypothetical protein